MPSQQTTMVSAARSRSACVTAIEQVELTPKRRCHEDIRAVMAEVNPVRRGWDNYFRTGNASKKFKSV